MNSRLLPIYPVVLFGCFVLSFLGLSAQLGAQNLSTPLERCGYMQATPHDSLLQYLEVLKKVSTRLTVEDIGTSVQGRRIPMVHVAPTGKGTALPVLIFCQQHGNEPSGKEAVLFLLKKLASARDSSFAFLDLYIVPSLNPDGNESKKRANANGADLNRDHLLISQPEVQAIQSLFRRLDPLVTLDVHEYSAFRKEFRAAGYVRAADEQFGAPTNLNVSPVIRKYALESMFPYLDSVLQKRKIRFSNYYKMDGPNDTVRASTTSIDDGRQSFAILNIYSFILEGKNGRDMHDALERRTNSQLAAIEAFLSFVHEQRENIREMVRTEQKIANRADSVIVQMDYRCGGSNILLPMTSLRTNSDTSVSMLYSPVVTPIFSVRPPAAYGIPRERKDIIEFLDRHGVAYLTVDRPAIKTGEIATVLGTERVWMENKINTRVRTRIRVGPVTLRTGDILVPLDGRTARMLVIALEPASMWGIVQYDDFPGLCETGKDYPIIRIVDLKGKN